MVTRISQISVWAAIAASLLVGAGGCGAHSHANQTSNFRGFGSDVTTVQVISAEIGGKNVFIPSTIVVSAGRPQSLSVFNTTDKPHGFAIAGLSIETVLMPGEEVLIDLPPLTASEIYNIGCHLHPPHRHATLVVVPGR